MCSRIRTARAIGAYVPVVEEWDEPMFVTLTLQTVTADRLAPRIGAMLKAIRSIGISIRNTHKLSLKAIRKLECTSRPGGLFHPHFHFIVAGRAQAELLRDLWLSRFGSEADPQGQDIRPCDDGSFIELFKYATKLLTRTADGTRIIPVAELDTIFQAMKGRRVWQPMGFKLPKEVEAEIESDTLDVEAGEAVKRIEETIYWEWCQDMADWIDKETGECLSEHEPSEFITGIVESLDGRDGRPVPVQQLSTDTAVSSTGALVSTDHRPPTTDHQLPQGVNIMLRAGTFPIEGSTFTVDGQDYLLRERDNPTKAKPKYYLLAMPGGHYVSGLWPKGPDVYSVDFTRSDGAERVYRLDFKTPGFVQIVDHGFSRRSLKSAPWHRSRRTGKN